MAKATQLFMCPRRRWFGKCQCPSAVTFSKPKWAKCRKYGKGNVGTSFERSLWEINKREQCGLVICTVFDGAFESRSLSVVSMRAAEERCVTSRSALYCCPLTHMEQSLISKSILLPINSHRTIVDIKIHTPAH